MSFVFSKNKEKRSRSASGDSNSSFVKNVTSRVSGLLPAGITKWFSSPSSSSANGSAAMADGTDSSTEDEAPESPSMVQPPAKRIRYSSPMGKYSQLTTSEITTTSNVITETGSVLYNSIQSPPGQHTFRRETNYVSTPIRFNTDETMDMMERTDRNLFMQHTVSAMGQSIAQKRKSIFNTDLQREQALIACAAQQGRDPNLPYFKPDLLAWSFNHDQHERASASSSYTNQPNIKQRKMANVNKLIDPDSVNMSASTRKVMELLENYASPLIEAKRIPRYELSELRNVNRSISIQPRTSTTNLHKTQELYIPSNATLIRIKARNRLMDSTKAARQIIASHSSTLAPYPAYAPSNAANQDWSDSDTGPAKSQSKLKSRLTRPNRGDDPFGLPEAVELPNAVLQIDKNNLPKFSFDAASSSLEKAKNRQSSECFQFSSPLPILPDVKTTESQTRAFDFGSPEKAADNSSPPKFSFGKQTSVDGLKTKQQPEKNDQPAEKQNTGKPVLTFAKASNDWKCSDCWVMNKEDASKCACCGAKPLAKQTAATTSETVAKCSTCKLSNSQPGSNKCVNCKKMRANLKPMNSLPVTKKINPCTWLCGDCFDENEKNANKCASCGCRKGGTAASTAPAPVAATPNKAAGPAIAEKDWRCEDCLITNKPSITKCAACGGAKPGTKPASKTLPSIASTDLSKGENNKMLDIIKAQKSYWECSICLASNANDKPTCLCCDAPRYKEDKVQPKFSNFKFNADSNTGFKFGIDPQVQETNLAKKVEASKPKNAEESETNNNIVPKIPTFTFTLTAKTSADKVDNPSTDEPKPSFSFGIPKQNATPVATTLATPATQPDIVKQAEDKEKPQEVPSITFKLPEVNTPSSGLFTPRSPTTTNPQNAMNAFLNHSTETQKAVSPNKLPAQPSTTLDAPKPQFSFSAEVVKPSTDNFFTPPASTAITSTLTTRIAPATSPVLGMFGKPTTAAVPVTSFFSKPEMTPVPSTMPFQNNAQSTPATPTALAPFSFGSNQGANPAPVNVTKNYFNFGSTTTTPAFSAVPQSNAGTFALTPSNPMTNGPTNTLDGNGISTNPLAHNMTGNPLGGNNLTPSMFNATAKEAPSMWPNTNEQSNQANPFNTVVKEPFSFGATSTPFGSQVGNQPKEGFTFGASTAPSPFGASASTCNMQPHMFGGNASSTQNMFGMSQSSGNQQSMFASPAPMFGAAPAASPMSVFNAPSASPFGASTASIGSFDTPSSNGSFTFGMPQASSSTVFGFGQQPPQPQMQGIQPQQMQNMQPAGIQPGMYNFGGGASPGPVQFNMGSAPNLPTARKVRKAVRRNQRT